MTTAQITALQEKYKGEFPKPIVKMALDLNLKVYDTGDMKASQSGEIIKEGEEYVIYVNEAQPATRKRFTVAHEIAHFLLHKDRLDKGSSFEDSVKQPVSNGGLKLEEGRTLSTEERKMEQEANDLAGELLMPKEEFIAEWERAENSEQVAEKFNVSVAAVTVRAKALLGETIF